MRACVRACVRARTRALPVFFHVHMGSGLFFGEASQVDLLAVAPHVRLPPLRAPVERDAAEAGRAVHRATTRAPLSLSA